MSYELKIAPKNRVSGRFISEVRKALLNAALDEKSKNNISQQAIADMLGVNRSFINRLLRGDGNLTLRTIAEISWALGYKPRFSLEKKKEASCSNYFKTDYEKTFKRETSAKADLTKPMATQMQLAEYTYEEA